MISTVYLSAFLVVVQTILAAPTALLTRSEVKIDNNGANTQPISSKCSGGLTGYNNYGYGGYNGYNGYGGYNGYNSYNGYSGGYSPYGMNWGYTPTGAVYCPFTSNVYYQTINNYLGSGACNNYASNYVFGNCDSYSCASTYNAWTASLTSYGYGSGVYGIGQLSKEDLKADSKQV